MKTKTKKHVEKIEKIYEKQGVAGVCEYANENNIPYKYCRPCDANMPILETTCLVCGCYNK